LADCAGAGAADEREDGPCGILSAVDKRRDKRLLSAVLDHTPDHEDMRAFLGRLKTALTARDLTLLGITTDGSTLEPVPLAEGFGGVRPQLCEGHGVADGVQAVLGAVASERKRLAAQRPQLPTGRPSTPAAPQAARTQKRLDVQRAGLFTQRYLFVPRHLSKTERQTLWRITRGVPQWQQLRAILEQGDALFERRCRPQTALDTRATLRRRVQRFKGLGATLKKLFAPTLEKALTWLDDK
jgi:hypothetical protein